jgi:hypothetical protein
LFFFCFSFSFFLCCFVLVLLLGARHIRHYSYSRPALSAAVLELQAEAACFFFDIFCFFLFFKRIVLLSRLSGLSRQCGC